MREWKESENDKNGYFLLNISSNFQPRMMQNVNEWRDSTVGSSITVKACEDFSDF